MFFYSGYMSPEYAMCGHYSVKSDVFSFGVLILEIVTGRRNSGSYNMEQSTDLLSIVSPLTIHSPHCLLTLATLSLSLSDECSK